MKKNLKKNVNEVKKLKKVKVPKISDYQIEIKKKPHKQKVLAEVLAGAAIAGGVTLAVKALIDSHHKKPAKKAEKKVAKKSGTAKKSKRVTKSSRKPARKTKK